MTIGNHQADQLRAGLRVAAADERDRRDAEQVAGTDVVVVVVVLVERCLHGIAAVMQHLVQSGALDAEVEDQPVDHRFDEMVARHRLRPFQSIGPDVERSVTEPGRDR